MFERNQRYKVTQWKINARQLHIPKAMYKKTDKHTERAKEQEIKAQIQSCTLGTIHGIEKGNVWPSRKPTLFDVCFLMRCKFQASVLYSLHCVCLCGIFMISSLSENQTVIIMHVMKEHNHKHREYATFSGRNRRRLKNRKYDEEKTENQSVWKSNEELKHLAIDNGLQTYLSP